MTEWITVRHPETGGQARVAASALRQMEKSGWVQVTGEQQDDTGNDAGNGQDEEGGQS
jgi:hypothetical protein